MQYVIGIHRLTTALTVMLVLAASPCLAQFMFTNMMNEPGKADQVDAPEVDWNQEFIYAVGKGVVSADESNASKAFQKAQGEGKMKAVAGLINLLKNTVVNYKAVGSDYINKDLALASQVEERLAGVEVLNEKQIVEGGETVVQVTVRAPMYGPNGVGAAVLESVFNSETTVMAIPSGLNVEKSGAASSSTTSISGTFTSLIIDCEGLKLEHALNPKLRKADGAEFWGTPTTGINTLQNHGAVAYAETMDDAKSHSLAGSAPLVVRAMGRAGSRFMCDPVLSDQDSKLILDANTSSQFLNKFNVILVVDKE